MTISLSSSEFANQFEFLLCHACCKNDPVFKTFSLPTNLLRVELFYL
jgi:hypothetical protein